MNSKRSIIDTHFHIWDVAVLTIPTVQMFEKQLKPKYTLEDYLRTIEGFNIVESYYAEVDAAKEQHRQEAEMAIAMCHDSSNVVAGATIGADLASESFSDYIVPFSKERAVKSVRHNLFAANPNVSRDTLFRDNVRLLGDLGLMCDLVMPAENIMFGVELVKACPDTQFVIDHCGVCPILGDKSIKKHWKEGISAYAKHHNTICKVSECCFTNPEYVWQVNDVQEIIYNCISSFGADRIVYGTNWPICEITGTVERWIKALELVLQEFPEHYSEKLFYGNAHIYYES